MKICMHLCFCATLLTSFCFASTPSQSSAPNNKPVLSPDQKELAEKSNQAALHILNLNASRDSILAAATARRYLRPSEKEELAQNAVLVKNEMAKWAVTVQSAQMQGTISKQEYEEVEEMLKTGDIKLKTLQEEIEKLPALDDSLCAIQ